MIWELKRAAEELPGPWIPKPKTPEHILLLSHHNSIYPAELAFLLAGRLSLPIRRTEGEEVREGAERPFTAASAPVSAPAPRRKQHHAGVGQDCLGEVLPARIVLPRPHQASAEEVGIEGPEPFGQWVVCFQAPYFGVELEVGNGGTMHQLLPSVGVDEHCAPGTSPGSATARHTSCCVRPWSSLAVARHGR